ncbi:MAG: choice-of-anchor U domain-containing protein, partial [Cyanobacteriota bacterium]
ADLSLSAISAAARAAIQKQAPGRDPLFGQLDFSLNDIAPGSLQRLDLTLPQKGVNDPVVLKQTASGNWETFGYDPITGTGALFYDDDDNGSADRAVLWIRDGGRGDSDGLANGRIVDPAVLAAAPPAITLSVSRPSMKEDDAGFIVYTFSRTGPTTSALTVHYTLGGSAVLGSDYTIAGQTGNATSRSVTFAIGSSTASVNVDPNQDSVVEPNRTVTFSIASGSGYSIGSSGAVTATLLDDDSPAPSRNLSIASSLPAAIGNTIAIPIQIDNTAGLLALELTVDFDPLVLAIADGLAVVTAGERSGSWTFTANTNTAGRIVISGYGTVPLEDGFGSIATLQLRVNTGVIPGPTNLDLVAARINKDALSANLIDGSLMLQPPTFQVLGIRQIPGGVALNLSEAPDLSRLNLYDGPDPSTDDPDLRLTTAGGQAVNNLSLHWDDAHNELLLIRSDSLTGIAASPFNTDLLAAGDYTLRIASRSDGLVSASTGELLDGNRDGITGDAYTINFARAAYNNLIAIGDTARGPGQALSLNGSPLVGGQSGLPVLLSTTATLNSLNGTIQFDASVINNAGLMAGADLPGDWILTVQPAGAGSLHFSASGSTAISGNNRQLFRFTGTVANAAIYGSTSLVKAAINTSSNPSLAFASEPGLLAVAFSGDVTGNGSRSANKAYSSLDASYIQRVVVGLDSGFDAYAAIAPTLIGDVTGNGDLSSLDASLLQQRVVGLPVASFPEL